MKEEKKAIIEHNTMIAELFEKVVGLKGFILLLFTITYIILTQFELSILAKATVVTLVYLIGAVLNLETKEAERKYLLKKLFGGGKNGGIF